ncbi:MAG: DUF4012 domain-containing protein, partial [Actinomycetota bacterium]|nr:DUF4012 domain-containing protein [Actinomycetota bacterium]
MAARGLRPVTFAAVRRSASRVLAGLGVAVLLWVAWATVSIVRAGLDARAGRDAAERARNRAVANVTSPDSIADLRRARAQFISAHDRLSSAATKPARLLPVLGRQLQSVDAVSVGAAHVAGVASRALTEVQAALMPEHSSGPARVRLLGRMAEIATGADRELGDVRPGPGHLIGPVAQAHDRLVKEVTDLHEGLRRGAAGATAAADLLAGPRRYLVLAANNAEMRSGEGMALSAGVLETDAGALTVTAFRPTPDLALPSGAVPLGGDLADRWGWLQPNQEWRNLGVSPRFDVTAPLAARMWEATGGGPVDGVLMLDVSALRA